MDTIAKCIVIYERNIVLYFNKVSRYNGLKLVRGKTIMETLQCSEVCSAHSSLKTILYPNSVVS